MKNPFLSSLFVLTLVVILSLAIGSVFISPAEMWKILQGVGEEKFTFIIWNIRLPRTVLVALTGAALSRSGAA